MVCSSNRLIFFQEKRNLYFFLGYYASRNDIDQKAIVVDPVGGILISLYIIKAWIGQANRKLFHVHSNIGLFFFVGQVKRLTGYTAKPQFLSQITVDFVFVYYFCRNLFYRFII